MRRYSTDSAPHLIRREVLPPSANLHSLLQISWQVNLPPDVAPPTEIRPYQGFIKHRLPRIRPSIKPTFLKGARCTLGGWLIFGVTSAVWSLNFDQIHDDILFK